MLIQPDTYIRLIKNCPLDKTYDHTIYFESPEKQVEYFKVTLQGIPFNKQSYQRYDKGVLHIQAKAEDLYECNYLMFKNSAFGDKYFYAFVTSIEYVNNVSSRVYYELDVMQTWFFDYDLENCFVEREHSLTDNIGENLVPENLETGDYFIKKLDVSQCPFNSAEYDVIIIQGTNKLNVNGEYQCVVSNVFSGLDVTRYTTPSSAYEALKQINEDGKSDSVVAVYMVPRAFWGTGESVDYTPAPVIRQVSAGLENPYSDTFDGFTPDNNKLYTEPYFGLICRSSSGNSHKYAYEYFSDPNNPIFGMLFSIGSTPECVLTPWNYKGATDNYAEEITCNDFPPCAYATDTFKAYLAQHSGRLASMLPGVIGSLATGAIGQNIQTFGFNPVKNLGSMGPYQEIASPTSTDISTFSSILGTLGALHDVSILPPTIRGSTASAISYTRNTVGFIFYKYRIRREFAEIIDGYFNMFGYATNKVKMPNINSRPHWNYVKTKGCVIHGGVPADDMARIHAIYDRGITFWKRGYEIGDYSLDNKPVRSD